ncbi:MAG: serine hydrolase, partial [Bacteroidales bacterium]|nr:serine hydrolase [Bacteroidales bacterium]
MSVSKAGRIVIGATAAVLAAVGVAALAGTGRLHKEDPKLPVNLNETLTNEMSDTSSLLGFDLKVRQYLNLWGLQGASLSIMRNDSLLFAKGYGWADTKKRMQPGNILRMASVSKLVTAAGIMVLQERGELSLSSTVFGPDGILDDSLYNAAIADPLY